MKRLTLLLLLVLAAGPVWAADGTWNYPVPSLGGLNTGDMIYSPDGRSLSNKALTGTDGSVFLDAVTYCVGDTGTIQNGLIPVRVAANDWALARTSAGAETINYRCSLNSWLQRYGATTGIKINTIALVYQITVANATSHTFNGIKTVTYANGVANSLSSNLNGTVTLSTASTANPYLTSGSITTPVFFPSAANMAFNLDATVVLANTGVFRLYGVQVNFTRLDH